jgi:dUTP pyrophosphatase
MAAPSVEEFNALKKKISDQEIFIKSLYNYNLKMRINDSELNFLKELYEKQISDLNKKYPDEANKGSKDSGFDLICPYDVVIQPGEKILYDLKVAFEPEFIGGYYLFPRSSFGKTSLRLCNSVGIIDNSYRGTVKSLIENIGRYEISFKKGERYFQICHPSLIAMNVKIVTSLSETSRGDGGYGSTGK